LAIKSQGIISTSLVNVYKSSETDFIDKVEQEKRQALMDGHDSEDTKTVDGGSDDEVKPKGPNIFANAMNPLKLKEEKARKIEDKKRKVQEMRIKQANMRPFVIFVGVKDNPLPYERKYINK